MKNFVQSLLIFIPLVSLTTGSKEVVVYGQVGGTATLQKSAEGADSKKIYIFWHSDTLEGPILARYNPFHSPVYITGSQWADRVALSDYSLIIRNIQEEDFRTFICKEYKYGTQDIITKYKLSKVNVAVSPNSTVVAGDSVTLDCNADTPQGHAKPQIYWLNPQREIRTGNQRGELTMRLSGRDSGEWICVVTSDNRETQAKISVKVIDLSPAPLYPLYTSVSSPLSIPCSILPHISWDQLKAKNIQGGHWLFFPKPASTLTPEDSQKLFSLSLEDSLTWKANQDRGLAPPGPQKNDLSLHRARATEADRGEYICRLEFENLNLYRTVRVEVLEILSSAGTELVSGQQLNLTCSLGHALPSDLEVKWIPPEQSSLGSALHSTHLTIPEVGKGDSGKWKCELWQNKTLLTSAVITLQIEPKLSVWLLVTICGTSVIFILILSVIIIRQRRKRWHPRHRFCQCKHPKPKGFYRT
ncbi:hypothetical protein LDENG_00049860 [Lucifuga dentata]|nr:hypothetical protein LDENG_00049860 [Lucifuga dentata]